MKVALSREPVAVWSHVVLERTEDSRTIWLSMPLALPAFPNGEWLLVEGLSYSWQWHIPLVTCTHLHAYSLAIPAGIWWAPTGRAWRLTSHGGRQRSQRGTGAGVRLLPSGAQTALTSEMCLSTPQFGKLPVGEPVQEDTYLRFLKGWAGASSGHQSEILVSAMPQAVNGNQDTNLTI